MTYSCQINLHKVLVLSSRQKRASIVLVHSTSIPGPSGAKQLLYRLCLFQKYIFYITFTEFWHKYARRVIFVYKQSSQILGKRKQEKWLTAERIILTTEMTLNTWNHAWLTDEDTGRKLRQYHNNKVGNCDNIIIIRSFNTRLR